MAAGPHMVADHLPVALLVVGAGEEVVGRAVVPQVIDPARHPRPDVRLNPLDLAIGKAPLGLVQCNLAEVDDGDVGEPVLDEAVDERRGAASHVDDRRIARDPELLDESQAQERTMLVPARVRTPDRAVAIVPVDPVPRHRYAAAPVSAGISGAGSGTVAPDRAAWASAAR
ncbi:MAG: hypothetical protein NTU77_01710 [Actinobacteria bacterium]|nr:hypothetical protein [Actinomycetota bacterium]